MASKGKKAATATPSSSQQSTTGRPSSPMSPTLHSRMQEKVDLQNLNDRLANYIDRVRYLEGENSRLSREVQSSHETVSREVTNLKSMYDHELSDARKLLDETHKEKAKLEIEVKRMWEENEDLKAALAKKSKDLIIAQNDVRVYETRCNDLQLKYNQAQSDAKKAITDKVELEKERDKLRKMVDDFRKQLEEESLARVDVENSNQSLREELSFKDQIHQQQISETRSRKMVEISEIDGRLAEKYEAKLQMALQELRDQYEAQIHNNRAEIEQLYERKIKGILNESQRHSGAQDELRQTRIQIDTLTQRISELESLNAAQMSRNRDLDNQFTIERQRHMEELAHLEAELARMRDEMELQLREYQDLMDIKVSLDMEIAAYRKMLESEEHRLNISPGSTPDLMSRTTRGGSSSTARRTPVRGGVPAGKRKRTLLDESQETTSDFSVTSSAKGDVEIIEVCPDGRYVKLHNKSNKEIVLSGWQLIRKAGDNETSFKFHRSVKIEGAATITVWSSDVGQSHEPPTNIVMKGQKWFVGDNMTTVLINSDGEQMAQHERKRRMLSTASTRYRESSYYSQLSAEEFHHQHGDPQGEEKCRIM